MAVLPGTVARGEDPCAADVKELCPNVKPGSGRVSGCLQRNEAKLSQACRERLQADAATSRRLLQEFGRSCRGDVDDFCAGVEPGSGRVNGAGSNFLPPAILSYRWTAVF